ncbi:MAG: crossover junction endodeoxyribonuclease RuvC [Elusimicrobiota bacterium]
MKPANGEPTRVLGVDPGVSETGWAVLESAPGRDTQLVASGLIRTSPRTEFPERLRAINEKLSGVLEKYRPDRFAIEEMFFSKAAHTIRATLQTRGVIILAAAQNGTPVHEYNPRQVKAALTGSGSAPKSQMQKMVQATLKLRERLTPDDIADAAAIAICDLRLGRMKSLKVLGRIGGGGIK